MYKSLAMIFCFALSFGAVLVNQTNAQKVENMQKFAKDIHSFSNPQETTVKHVALDWTVSFEDKTIKGSATLTVERQPPITTRLGYLTLDTRDLKIEKVETSTSGKTFTATEFSLGETDKFLGTPLKITMPSGVKFVKIYYSTSPNASGLQWLSPEQTAGKKQPFMFSQAQAIHARSFIPLQDSPGVRVTYSARVRTPKNLLAVMSASGNSQTSARNGDYSFEMTTPIPTYLIAIAVGDLKFKSLGARTGVYSEPSMLEKSAYELADTEKMVTATEKLYGPYRWGRYDLLVLPPSFPFGGMENPRLTFATPTILAGDRSLVSLVAHELAHSWSGNLVTNATWSDFWLNEGTTTYIERRIIESLYGKPRREMEALLGKRELTGELADFDERDEILHVDLTGRDPDDGMTEVAYEKGALFWRWLEESYGRERFDKFMRSYFDSHAFQSITTETFTDYLFKNLIDKNYPTTYAMSTRGGAPTREMVNEWLYKPGLPKNAPEPKSDAFDKVAMLAKEYLNGTKTPGSINTKTWTTQEWLHFLQSMPEGIGTERMAELDKAFNLTKIGNSEIAFQWLLMSIKEDYKAADARLESFLVEIGRRKFVRPLFAELAKTPEGMKRACAIYAKSRSGYHPITQATVDAIVKCN
ncbi:MAG TPA: M1 family metallopeptidase [Pyrinomonadaceae bacterium]|nr:M1 family metallopeptidase [Pyrinomonadaceae bacterium]